MNVIEVFLLLQVLDFLTTMVGVRMGGAELNPFVRWLMHMDTVAGLTAIKLLGFALAGFCIWKKRLRVINWVNYYFAALVLWNLVIILRAVSRAA